MALGNLASRVLVAIVALPILLFAIYQSSHVPTWIIVFIVSLLAMNEYFTMGNDDHVDRNINTIIGGVAAACFYWISGSMASLTAITLAWMLPALYYLFRFGDLQSAAGRLNQSTVGIVYAGLMTTFIALIKRDFDAGADLVVLLLATAWMSDTGGYFAGKKFGKSKLYPAVSPNKTWAGSIGGVFAVAIGAAAFKMTLLTEFSWIDIYALAIPGAILGQIGDLVESLIKRSNGVKDSGALLPGHGGILDRVDAVIFIAPYFYLYLSYR